MHLKIVQLNNLPRIKNEVEISGGQKTDGEESNMWKGLGGDDGEGEEEEEGGGEGGAVMKIK